MFCVRYLCVKSMLNYSILLCLALIPYKVKANDTEDVKHLSKRQQGFQDYRMCAPNFEIHQDKIIRTEESKRMGAKYLNGKDVTSKDECIKFCCETPNCNVFVLEEKVFNQRPGTCYLFECGTPDNFKCKFTRHNNYSSAVLIINRPQMQLEDEIQYTQHERELTSLRIGENSTKSKNCHHTTKLNTVTDDSNHIKDSKETPKSVEDGNTAFGRKIESGRCSRYQFECRSSGECIAIYNACDGIPQCADHSDEDPELGCPTNAPIISRKTEEIQILEKRNNSADFGSNNVIADRSPLQQPINYPFIKDKGSQEQELLKSQPSNDQSVINRQSLTRQYKFNQWQSRLNQQAYNNLNRNEIPTSENQQMNMNVDSRMGSQHAGTNYGREGELLDDNSWVAKSPEGRLFKQSYGPLHNFNHKENDVNIPYNYGEYGNMGMNSPFEKLNNGYTGNNYYQPSLNSWHHKLNPVPNYEEERRFLEQKNAEPARNRAAPEYYYEEVNVPVTKIAESTETFSQPKVMNNVTVKSTNENKSDTTIAQNTTSTTKGTTQSTKESTHIHATTTEMKKDHEEAASEKHEDKQNEPNSHRKLEKPFSAELSEARQQLLQGNVLDGYTEQPNGAFVSLTLGICVTAIMVFVVGCRLKVVRRRTRRGGKAPYAHDADFLVNGMYL